MTTNKLTHGGMREGSGRPQGSVKKARLTGIVTVTCSCPKCGSDNVTQGGSLMVCPGDPTPISCDDCGITLELPKRASL
jgi:hypothetical protein